MKLKEDFMIHDDGDEHIMIDVTSKFSGLVRSNSTAGFIVNMLKSEISEDEIVSAMLAKYDAPEAVLRRDVHGIIEKLRSINAIDD